MADNIEKQNMEIYTIALIAKYGMDLALIILKNMKWTVTIDDAIARLESIKTTEQYIKESAERLGVPERPLGT